MVTVYKQLYFNVISQPCTKTIVGICRSAHENMTAVSNDNSDHYHHKAPLDLSAFYINFVAGEFLVQNAFLAQKMQSWCQNVFGSVILNSDPPPGLKGSLSM